MEPAHLIRIKLIEPESATDFGEGLRRVLRASPEKEKEHSHYQEDHNSSRPQKPSASAAVSTDDYTT